MSKCFKFDSSKICLYGNGVKKIFKSSFAEWKIMFVKKRFLFFPPHDFM